jgi:hypothetical protein
VAEATSNLSGPPSHARQPPRSHVRLIGTQLALRTVRGDARARLRTSQAARDGAVRAGEAPSRAFLEHARGTYAGPLPKYVVEEFRCYLACGDFARGFVHVMCTSCGDDMPVSFSCKLRRVGSAIGIGRARRRQNATYGNGRRRFQSQRNSRPIWRSRRTPIPFSTFRPARIASPGP